MRKQLYYALAALMFGTAFAPAEGYAEVVTRSATPTTISAHSADASRADALKKRKKRKKRRAGRRRAR